MTADDVVIGTWSPICSTAVLLSITVSDGEETRLTSVISFKRIEVHGDIGRRQAYENPGKTEEIAPDAASVNV